MIARSRTGKEMPAWDKGINLALVEAVVCAVPPVSSRSTITCIIFSISLLNIVSYGVIHLRISNASKTIKPIISNLALEGLLPAYPS